MSGCVCGCVCDVMEWGPSAASPGDRILREHERLLFSESSSPLLDSLRCYNNYMSYVHCEWRNPEKLPVQLWFEKGDNR